MLRHDRARFIAFGIVPLLNVIALLLYGLGLATHGRGGAAASLPVLVVLAGAIVLVVPWAAVKRGRDLGWSAWVSLAACVGSMMLGPAVLLLAGYLAFARGQSGSNEFGPPPRPATVADWARGVALLLFPWVVLAFAARLLS